MGLLSSKNGDVQYLSCVVDVFIKYASFKPLKDKKTKTFFYGFAEVINKSKCEPNKLIKFDQGK